MTREDHPGAGPDRRIEPRIDRSASPDDIRRDHAYLDTVEEIWQGLRKYVT